ncbi:prolipoprotein diacylglyceryl transferase [Christensenellaceae bacterium]|nr:prolipoprotein diacylglyceryl transferase [Christensenellaceae bacterium]BDF61593.1 prolipoprotein diacylglyceryl transferase [Christensenellaceae bacterium]
MYNNLLTIGPVTVHGYGLMIAVGIICALLIAIYRGKKRKMDTDAIITLCIFAVVFGFLGGKLLYVIQDFQNFLANPMEILSGSGFVVYGGIILAIVAAILYCRKKKYSFMEYFDLFMPSVAVAQGFGRIGCFLAGCCYGAETSCALGVVFPAGSLAPSGVSLLPTQLFSAAGDFLLALVLILYARKQRRAGRVGALYLILYGIGRSIIEIFRADFRGEIGIFSTSQFISIFIVIAGVALFLPKALSSRKTSGS